MDNTYDFFPLMLESPVAADAFDLFLFGDISDCAEAPWCRSWLNGQYNEKQLLSDVSRIGNEDVLAFVAEFVESYKFFGVIRLDPEHRDSFEQNSWVVFVRRSSSVGPKPTVLEMINALPGEYCYISEREIQNHAETDKNDTLNLFFAIFGRLRDSFPFLGGDYFLPRPLPRPKRTFSGRDWFEKRWVNSVTVYVRGNLDYFQLALDGAVGYMPIEGERRIVKISDSFSEFLLYWIKDDRRKYYDLRLEVMRAERSGFKENPNSP